MEMSVPRDFGIGFFGIYDATNNTVHTENFYIYITIPDDENWDGRTTVLEKVPIL